MGMRITVSDNARMEGVVAAHVMGPITQTHVHHRQQTTTNNGRASQQPSDSHESSSSSVTTTTTSIGSVNGSVHSGSGAMYTTTAATTTNNNSSSNQQQQQQHATVTTTTSGEQAVVNGSACLQVLRDQLVDIQTTLTRILTSAPHNAPMHMINVVINDPYTAMMVGTHIAKLSKNGAAAPEDFRSALQASCVAQRLLAMLVPAPTTAAAAT